MDRLVTKYNLFFHYIAIGLECDIRCCADIKTAISNSKNVIAWLIRTDRNVILPDGLEREKVSDKLDAIAMKCDNLCDFPE